MLKSIVISLKLLNKRQCLACIYGTGQILGSFLSFHLGNEYQPRDGVLPCSRDDKTHWDQLYYGDSLAEMVALMWTQPPERGYAVEVIQCFLRWAFSDVSFSGVSPCPLFQFSTHHVFPLATLWAEPLSEEAGAV